MSERKAFLEKIHIKNFLSLRNVTLPLKPLTVLVGPNASGKSNVLNALRFFKRIVIDKTLPQGKQIRDSLWAGKANSITFQLNTKVEGAQTEYRLALKAETNNPIDIEELLVNDVNVISIKDGQGKIWDENGENGRKYKSKELALMSDVCSEKNMPITNVLTAFINSWNFYDFQPGFTPSLVELGSEDLKNIERFDDESSEFLKILSLSESAATTLNAIFRLTLCEVLSSWHENDQDLFYKVSTSLKASTNIGIAWLSINGNERLCLLEGYQKPIPLERASSGTLRLIGYYILLNDPELPPLIAIEEPERNLHPGALNDIANVLEQLAERTQVIITTHSSQLLDNFKSESLSNSLGVLLLRNRPGLGTAVLNLEEIRCKRESLDGWISDFGMGSAVFDSELLQDLMEEPVC